MGCNSVEKGGSEWSDGVKGSEVGKVGGFQHRKGKVGKGMKE